MNNFPFVLGVFVAKGDVGTGTIVGEFLFKIVSVEPCFLILYSKFISLPFLIVDSNENVRGFALFLGSAVFNILFVVGTCAFFGHPDVSD